MTRRTSPLRRFTLALTVACAAAPVAPCLVPSAAALPLYASRQGATCVTCHVDPNGGGIRNEVGFAYLRNRHSIERESKWEKVTVDPKLNDWITLGVDLRVMYYASHVNGGRTLSTSTFFPMQGQVNLAVMPHEHLTLVASHGITVDEPGVPAGYVAREIYGMVEGLPAEMYARIGRFRLPFGLRQDDHTSFTRDQDFLPYDSQKPDAGIEVGRIGTAWFAQGSFVNNDEPLVSRAETFAAKVGHASESFQFGLSGLHKYYNDVLWSLYASATRGRLSALGEYAGGTLGPYVKRNETAFFAELDYRVLRGLNVRAKLDYADLDRDGPGGLKRRYLGEVDINPIPFVEAKISYRYYDSEDSGIHKDYLALFYFPF